MNDSTHRVASHQSTSPPLFSLLSPLSIISA
jgi:hypothetical protein